MIPQGDPHPSTPRPPRPHRGARLRAYRKDNPGPFLIRASGSVLVPLGALCLVSFITFDTARDPWVPGVMLAVLLFVACAILVALFSVTSADARGAERAYQAVKLTNLPTGTDPAKLAEAWRLVRAGAPGPDPETNRLGRTVVEQELGRAKTVFPSLLLMLGMALVNTVYCLNRIRLEGVSFPIVLILGLSALIVVLACVTPSLAARRRRRAEAFRDAYDHADGGAPDTAG
ncbi:hypothetical protein Q8791_17525 [Nocardiopsis sp. CT-R113]|uniref:Integral membrane protein n=1 Tax=Nocardiopsis codii TaxID=3065942 RepID=A0ABU7K9V4_9ACTN|nr:hypothetical protein [Nocardiopsis sp. CT-R113]MEE2039018.1 hypothetical protein [Nocardiopsis sp. CT-R113]